MEERIDPTLAAVVGEAKATSDAASQTSARAEATGARRAPLPRACLLVVEDESAVQRLVARLAQDAGLEPVVVGSLADAAVALGKNNVRRAVVDLVLANGGAELLIETLKQRGVDVLVYSANLYLLKNLDGVAVQEKPGLDGLRAWLRRKDSDPETTQPIREGR